MKAFDVVGVGYSNVDYLGIVPRYPELDEKIRLLEFTMQGGGVTATAMAAVGRLGGKARYIGKVGDDDFGKFALAELHKDNVDTSRVVVAPGAGSQFSFIAVDKETGKRTIFWTSSGLMLEPDEIHQEDVLSGKVLHVDAHFPKAAIQAALWAREAGIPVVMDAGSVREGSAELAAQADCLVASELFARQFTGQDDPEKAAQMMWADWRRISAVTLGAEGCVFVTHKGTFHQPGFKVDVVDTTGAGDTFHGAFAYGVALGWDFPRTVEFACAVASLKCRKLGGRAGIPTMQETLEYLS